MSLDFVFVCKTKGKRDFHNFIVDEKQMCNMRKSRKNKNESHEKYFFLHTEIDILTYRHFDMFAQLYDHKRQVCIHTSCLYYF